MYIGLDFETTGLDPLKHVPLTLGLAWESASGIVSHEFTFKFPSSGRWDVEAMHVNKINPEMYSVVRPEYIAEDIDRMDWEICSFLMEREWSPFDKSLIPVGWNVGGFDMRFMQTFFPQASKFFSHRYMELNSLAYAADFFSPYKSNVPIKEACKGWAETAGQHDGHEVNWHNAEWDAIASVYSFKFMRERLENAQQDLQNA